MSMQTTDQWGSLLPKGLGTDQEATQATSAMRQSPWYQDWAKKNNLQFQGDQYGNASLNDNQQQDLYNQALQHGIGLNNKYDQVDQNGQISEAHHKLRNTLIGAGIGAAALSGFGAAGIGPLSGLFGTAAAPLASTTIGNGFIPAITGGAGMAAEGAGAGLAAGTGAGMAAAASSPLLDLGMALPSTQIGQGFIPALGTTSSMAGSGAASGGGGIIQKILGLANSKGGDNPLATISSLLGANSSGQKANRVAGADIGSRFANASVEAQNSANTARSAALRQLAQANYIQNKQPYQPTTIQLNGQQRTLPSFGMAPPPSSPDQLAGAANLANTAKATLAPGGTYKPNPDDFQSQPGTGEKIASGGATISGMLPSALDIFKMFRQ